MTSPARRGLAAGAVAGLVGGVASGVLLELMRMLTPDGVEAPAMALVAGAVHTVREPLAWVGYLVFAALIGAAFGWLLRGQQVSGGFGVVWGVLYGAFWWIVSGLVVIPALYGVGPMTPAAVNVIRNASLPWFAAMLLDGAVLGGVSALLGPRRPPGAEPGTVSRRAA
jgi:hypothetical protein